MDYWNLPIEGKIVKKIEQIDDYGGDELIFHMEDGMRYNMKHHQNCCECVYIHEVNGYLDDLLDTEILVAEERTNESDSDSDYGDIEGWTFYEFRTIKGSVTISWYGSSNGYYSIDVSFDEMEVCN